MASTEEPVFSAVLADVKHFTTLLRSVAFQQRVKIIASEAGLMVQVEEARSLQCRSYIPSNIFSSYTFNPRHVPSRANSEELDEDDHGHTLTPPPPPDVALEINLSHLIECLNIFGGPGSTGPVDGREGKRRSAGGGVGEEFDDEDDGDGGRPSRRAGGKGGESVKATRVTAGRISWLGEGEPLEVLLMDEGAVAHAPTTTCSLSTSEADFESDIEFPDDEEPALHVICAASWLKDALLSLDPSSSKVSLSTLIPPPSSGFFTPAHEMTANVDRPSGLGDQQGGFDFRIESQGTWGHVRMDFENRRPLCMSFIRNDSIRLTYRKALLLRAIRALTASQKVSLMLFPSGVLFIQCMPVAPQAPEDGKFSEAERQRRKDEREAKRRGEVTDGIIELRMMSLEEESDDDD